MANDPLPEVDYSRVLVDLKAKREAAVREQQRLAEEIKKLEGAIIGVSGLVSPTPPETAKGSSALDFMRALAAGKVAQDTSMYSASLAVLKEVGRPLTTPELIEALTVAGKVSDMSHAPMLYGAVKGRGDKSEIIRVGEGRDGRWALKDWPVGLL